MEANRSERKPAGVGLPSSVRKMRGINVDAPRKKGSEANRNEVLHSKLRVKLNRLVRRTHGCGKRLYMLVRSLAMARLRDDLYQR